MTWLICICDILSGLKQRVAKPCNPNPGNLIASPRESLSISLVVTKEEEPKQLTFVGQE